MAVVDDQEAWQRQIAGLMRFYFLLADGSPLMAAEDSGGVVAATTPSVPNRSIINAVVYESTAALAGAYGRLDAAYAGAGVEAWTVWVPDSDDVAAELLAARGHVLDADPEAMIADLEAVERPAEPVGLVRGASMDEIGRLNDLAYGMDGDFERALAGHTGAGFHVYVAGDGPDACAVFSDTGEDAAVWLVATAPEARGKGLATALMAHGMADARERGRTTSTLQATDAGKPIYERLGYRSVGEVQMWEKRQMTG